MQIAGENINRAAAAATLITGLALAVFFSDAQNVHAHERLNVPDATSVRTGDQNVLGFVDITRLNLFDARIIIAGGTVRLTQQRDLLDYLEIRRLQRNLV